MKPIARRARSVWGDAGELDDDFAAPADDNDNRPRGALIGPPEGKFVVHDVSRPPPPYPERSYRVVVTRAEDGVHSAFTVLASPGGGFFEVLEEDEEEFDELFEAAAMVPGKIAGLVNAIEAGAHVTFPIDLDNTRPRR